MKKILLKMGFIIFCMGVIIFLLLPFLETTAPVNATLKTGQAQIVTDNPLNVISKRLASLFKRKEKVQKIAPEQNDSTATLALAASYTPTTSAKGQMSAIAPKTAENSPSKTIEISSKNYPFDYENASFQTDNGEWVLVQQTAPQHSAPGMHEVNVHDNPYDRYVRQERAKNFGPQAPKQEIPDSKWARVITPIQKFFGLNAPYPVSSASTRVHRDDDKALSLGTARDKLGTSSVNKSSGYERIRLPLPDISPKEWALMTPQARQAYQAHKAARDFADLLSGDHAAREAAEIIADLKFPNPQTEQEKKAKEYLIARLTAENKDKIREKVLAGIEENAAAWDPTLDELGFTTDCNSSFPSINSACFLGVVQHEEAKKIQQAQKNNAQIFFEKTKFILPEGLSFTPVLGPTTPENFKQMVEDNPHMKTTGEIYAVMYEQKQCDSQRCFWLPNSKPSDYVLTDTFTTVGNSKIVPDPFNTYDTYKDAWINKKLKEIEEAQKNAPEKPISIRPEQIKPQLEKQYDKQRPNWVPYTDEDLRQINDINKDILTTPIENIGDKEPPTFLVLSNPGMAYDMAETLESPVGFVYSNPDPLSQSTDAIEGGESLTVSLANNLNAVKDATTEVTQQAIQEGVINATISQSNQTGGGFFNLLNTMRNWGKGKTGK